MKNVFNTKYTICRAKKPSSEPTREQIKGDRQNYLKSGGSIERINGPQAGGFKQRAFSNFEGDFASILEEEERWEDLQVPHCRPDSTP